MCALDDLRQLARIADQHDIARGTTHGDHVGEAHLPRLIDKQPIEALHILIAREEEGRAADHIGAGEDQVIIRSEEHTSELQSLMRNSYAVFCLKKKIK